MNIENNSGKYTRKAVQATRKEHFLSITYGEINEYLYDNLAFSIVSVFVLATILFWELSGFIEKTTLVAWYEFVLMVLALRIGFFIWFRKTRHKIKLQKYHYGFFVLGSSLSAIMWGILGSVLMPVDVVYQAFIIIMVSGIIAGSTISLGARYLASILYIFFSLVPIIIWEGIQIAHGTRVYWGVFIAMILYLFFSGITAFRNANLVLNNINLKNTNLHLLEKLNEDIQQIELFSQMGESLEKCRNEKEIGEACKKYLPTLFPEFAGAVFLLPGPNTRLKPLEVWGDFSSEDKELGFTQNECLGIEAKDLFISHDKNRCKHCHESSAYYVCVPLQTSIEFYGILHLKLKPYIAAQGEDFILNQKTLIARIAANISIALSIIQYQKHLQEEATQDKLTGLYNRRYLDNYFNIELARFKRRPTSISVIMIDIDNFKNFNDQYGHDVGDEILHEFGLFLKGIVRGTDFACRYGGEEFILILSESDLDIACKRAEIIREGVKNISILKNGNSISSLTVSIGIAVFPEQGDTQANIIEAADKALYRAKKEGRDRICIATK